MKAVSIGRLGEDAAVAYLRQQGYEIAARNYRTRQGEIDIVAKEGGCLCFVEVKTRKNDRFGLACEAVDVRKQVRLIGAAEHYLAYHSTEAAVRFDIVEVYGQVRQSGFVVREIRLIRNAFDASGKEG